MEQRTGPRHIFYLGEDLPRATLIQEKGPVVYLHIGAILMHKWGTLVHACWGKFMRYGLQNGVSQVANKKAPEQALHPTPISFKFEVSPDSKGGHSLILYIKFSSFWRTRLNVEDMRKIMEASILDIFGITHLFQKYLVYQSRKVRTSQHPQMLMFLSKRASSLGWPSHLLTHTLCHFQTTPIGQDLFRYFLTLVFCIQTTATTPSTKGVAVYIAVPRHCLENENKEKSIRLQYSLFSDISIHSWWNIRDTGTASQLYA